MIFTLSFEYSESDGDIGVVACLDGRPITEIIAAYEWERGRAIREGLVPAGSWRVDASSSGDWALPLYYIDGGPWTTIADRVFKRGRAFLLICGCGQGACSCTTVEVERTPDLVVWSSLRTWVSKMEPYPDFGPWTFDRRQYEAACAALRTQHPAGGAD